MMVVASEVGVMDFDPTEIAEKGRLQPGKILLIDTQEGKIYYDGEIKERLAAQHPYRQWLNTNRIELEKLAVVERWKMVWTTSLARNWNSVLARKISTVLSSQWLPRVRNLLLLG